MKNREWQMEQAFIFPEHVGIPVQPLSIRVTPGFTEKRTEEAVRLEGIYHIAARFQLGEGERVHEPPISSIYIGDIEHQEDEAYFEYAVPLHIDLPGEIESPVQVSVQNANAEPDGQGVFHVQWGVMIASQSKSSKVEELSETVKTTARTKDEPAKRLESLVPSREEPALATIQAGVADSSTALVQGEDALVEQSYHRNDDFLSFIAGLEDGVSSTVFHSNEVFVKRERYTAKNDE